MADSAPLDDDQVKTTLPRSIREAIETYQSALEDLVKVNSIFSIAVFVGLSMAVPGQRSLANRIECDTGITLSKRLVVTEVVSFACYLLSSLVAKALKIHLSVCRDEDFKKLGYKFVRGGLLVLSLWSSILGCIFLTISMVDVIQIKLGKVSCGSAYADNSAGSLIAIVALALVIYVYFTMHSIYYISTLKLD